ncbi:MAG: UDP-N-acetylmuramoyl-tripeptide--D-alanyl-D-alanine ligase [Planctomycetaceae bacterium]|nr:UDP-N-acetylmuramoyl-tripeptide--D-alanyl-D-alanine ligase [Planctomycetaceae bacterium]
MQPLPLSSLVDAVSGEAIRVRRLDDLVQRVVIDSRLVRSGDLFVPLAGERQDGHQFIADAIQRGAVAALAARQWVAAQKNSTGLIAVDDPLAALWQLAAWNRDQADALRIAVTGSVGKTTTRHMLHTVLSRRFAGIESPENYNNHIGVPLSLLQLDSTHEFAVLETAASRLGEIDRLARLIAPEIGLLTAIAPAHLEHFRSLEAICRAKGELLESLPASGIAVLNGDDPLVRRLARRAPCRVILAGEEIQNDVVATRVKVNDRRLRFRVGATEFQLPAVGRHHLNSALLSIAVAREIGLTDSEISAGLKDFVPMHGRCEKTSIGPWTVIDDSYNASPASMVAACETLRDWQDARRRVLVVGDMLELGEHSSEFHAQLGELVADCQFNLLIAVGPQAGSVTANARSHGMDPGCLGACSDFDTAYILLDCWLEPGDVILVKGSRGMHMEQVVEHLRKRAEVEHSQATSPLHKAA